LCYIGKRFFERRNGARRGTDFSERMSGGINGRKRGQKRQESVEGEKEKI